MALKAGDTYHSGGVLIGSIQLQSSVRGRSPFSIVHWIQCAGSRNLCKIMQKQTARSVTLSFSVILSLFSGFVCGMEMFCTSNLQPSINIFSYQSGQPTFPFMKIFASRSQFQTILLLCLEMSTTKRLLLSKLNSEVEMKVLILWLEWFLCWTNRSPTI